MISSHLTRRHLSAVLWEQREVFTKFPVAGGKVIHQLNNMLEVTQGGNPLWTMTLMPTKILSH